MSPSDLNSSDAAALRAELGHPIIDTDGHVVEFRPVMDEYLAEFAGARAVDRFRRGTPWYWSDDETRRRLHLAKPSWGFPARTMDHMASILPALLEERLGELGIDFVVMHPSPKKLGVPHLLDDELRQPMCRALNAYMADLLRPHSARMTPAAVIPMHHPSEAIEELDYAVNTLGMKTTMVASHAHRPRVGGEPGLWWDNFVLDSEYDYDPVWAKFQELRLVPGFHSGTLGVASRIVSTNATYNFIGHCAAAQEAMCKALVLGGVTRRFPHLKFAFEVSGISWAVSLFAELVDQWESRNPASLAARDPARFDLDTAHEVFRRYAPPRLLEHAAETDAIVQRMVWPKPDDLAAHGDEFAAAGIGTAEDFRDRFVRNFYFGCEASDRFSFLAFADHVLPLGARLKCVLGTDLGHYNPTAMSQMLPEAHRAVDRGLMTEDDFRAMTFENPVELFATGNPDFFTGTAIESEAQKVLQADS